MHGLINKAIEVFVIDTYGDARWLEISDHAGIGIVEFEAMLIYDASLTEAVLQAMEQVLGHARADMLEDLGTFLAASPAVPAIRRLLRFGGVTYEEFLQSLDELAERVRLAVEDLAVPELQLTEEGNNRFCLHCAQGMDGYGHVLLGVLRAMADDYGALAILEHVGDAQNGERIDIVIIQDAFAQAKSFDLGMQPA